MSIDPNYIDVAERIREFRDKYPDGTLQRIDWEIRDVGGKLFVVYTAAAYRTPDDTRPGIGTAWEPFPGPTNFTRDSELMNAETSAWGRAIVAAGAADAKRVASANEVANRQAGASTSAYTFTFGKHKGKTIEEVPLDYLKWLLQQPPKDGYEAQHAKAHAIYTAELERRSDDAA